MRSWAVYAIVAVLGAGAGVLVAGLPDRDEGDIMVAGDSTLPDTTTAVVSTMPPTTPSPSTIIETATTVADTTTSAPPSTAETTTVATTIAPTTVATTVPTTTASVPSTTAPVDRSAVDVVVANATIIGGVAGRTAETLRSLGWSSVETGDGSELFGNSVVYFVDGYGDAANQIVADLGFEGVFVVPIEEAPDLVGDFPNLQVLVYVGQAQV